MDPELNEIGKQQAVVVRYTLAQNLLFLSTNLLKISNQNRPICGFMILYSIGSLI
jgi:hypothetical protein